ncbi:hypothetical protein GJ496_006085 [Pomphorhynchus laevis]|nr:hypothetical protein GJ496_006085 [Pomphorhynchus laevis]
MRKAAFLKRHECKNKTKLIYNKIKRINRLTVCSNRRAARLRRNIFGLTLKLFWIHARNLLTLEELSKEENERIEYVLSKLQEDELRTIVSPKIYSISNLTEPPSIRTINHPRLHSNYHINEKFERYCSVCQHTKFSTKLCVSKHFCHFCNNVVCSRCSNLFTQNSDSYHDVTLKLEKPQNIFTGARCCNKCILKQLRFSQFNNIKWKYGNSYCDVSQEKHSIELTRSSINSNRSTHSEKVKNINKILPDIKCVLDREISNSTSLRYMYRNSESKITTLCRIEQKRRALPDLKVRSLDEPDACPINTASLIHPPFAYDSGIEMASSLTLLQVNENRKTKPILWKVDSENSKAEAEVRLCFDQSTYGINRLKGCRLHSDGRLSILGMTMASV